MCPDGPKRGRKGTHRAPSGPVEASETDSKSTHQGRSQRCTYFFSTVFKNVYQHEPTERQQRAGETPVSQFGRICARLGITLIGAGSPQAKGRVERNHGVHQDRLIKKMRDRKSVV